MSNGFNEPKIKSGLVAKKTETPEWAKPESPFYEPSLFYAGKPSAATKIPYKPKTGPKKHTAKTVPSPVPSVTPQEQASAREEAFKQQTSAVVEDLKFKAEYAKGMSSAEMQQRMKAEYERTKWDRMEKKSHDPIKQAFNYVLTPARTEPTGPVIYKGKLGTMRGPSIFQIEEAGKAAFAFPLSAVLGIKETPRMITPQYWGEAWTEFRIRPSYSFGGMVGSMVGLKGLGRAVKTPSTFAGTGKTIRPFVKLNLKKETKPYTPLTTDDFYTGPTAGRLTERRISPLPGGRSSITERRITVTRPKQPTTTETGLTTKTLLTHRGKPAPEISLEMTYMETGPSQSSLTKTSFSNLFKKGRRSRFALDYDLYPALPASMTMTGTGERLAPALTFGQSQGTVTGQDILQKMAQDTRKGQKSAQNLGIGQMSMQGQNIAQGLRMAQATKQTQKLIMGQRFGLRTMAKGQESFIPQLEPSKSVSVGKPDEFLGTRTFRYAPSLGGIVGLKKGRRPKLLTGLEMRPV